MLTVYQTVSTRVGSDDASYYLQETMEYYLNDHIALYDVASGELTTIYSVEDTFANPLDNYLEQPNSMTYGGCDCPTASDSLQVLDWSHMSAISEYDNDTDTSQSVYVASLRNINTVVAFYKDGSGLAWSISASAPTIESTLSFAATDMEFYDVHDAQLIKYDELLLMDDGNNRKDCTQVGFDDEVDCFTRAIKYKIDWETNIATVAWQFEFDVDSSATNTIETLDLASNRLGVADLTRLTDNVPAKRTYGSLLNATLALKLEKGGMPPPMTGVAAESARPQPPVVDGWGALSYALATRSYLVHLDISKIGRAHV